jgi:hypothetical protein
MITVTITSDERGEGKTYTAVRLLGAEPEAWLLVRPGQRQHLIRTFDLPPSHQRRIVEDKNDLRGQVVKYLIRDNY